MLDAKLQEVQGLVSCEVERLSALVSSLQAHSTHSDACGFHGEGIDQIPCEPKSSAPLPRLLPATSPQAPRVEPPSLQISNSKSSISFEEPIPRVPMSISSFPSQLSIAGGEYSTDPSMQKVDSDLGCSSMSAPRVRLLSFTEPLQPKTPDYSSTTVMFVSTVNEDVLSRWSKLVSNRIKNSNMCFLNEMWSEEQSAQPPSVTAVVQGISGLLARNRSLLRAGRHSRVRPQSRWVEANGRGSILSWSNGRGSIKSLLTGAPQTVLSPWRTARAVKNYVVSRVLKLRPLHPFAPSRVIWDLLGVFMLGLDIVMMPLPVFDSNTSGLPSYYDEFSNNLDIVAASYWTVDIFVSFSTGFTASDGNVEMRPYRIAKQYMRRWFTFDLVVVLTDWTALLTEGAALNHGSWLRLVRTALRVARLARVIKMSRALNRLWMMVNSEFLVTVLGVAKLMIIIVAVNHYVACGWFWLGTLLSNSWVDNKLNGDSASYAYFTSLHWSLTQFTPASMEVHPYNEVERCYNVIVIIVAMLTFSSFVSSITQAMTHLAHTNRQKAQQEVAIRHYLFEHNISHQLTGRIWAYVQHSRITSAKRSRYTDIPSLMRMPDCIKKDLRVEIFLPVLLMHPLFDFYSLVDSAALASICRHAALEVYLGAREEHLAFGQIIKSMFAVVEGTIEYHENRAHDREFSLSKRKSTLRIVHTGVTHTGTSSKSVSWSDASGEDSLTIGPGFWACEIALWANSVRNTGSFQAACSTELVTLHAETFRHQAIHHYSSVDVLRRYAKLFVDRFNEAGEKENHEDVLFNDSSHIVSMVQQCVDIDLKGKKLICRDKTVNRISEVSSASSTTESKVSRSPRPSVKGQRTSKSNGYPMIESKSLESETPSFASSSRGDLPPTRTSSREDGIGRMVTNI